MMTNALAGTTTTTAADAPTPLRLAFRLIARLHAVARGGLGHDSSDKEAMSALVDWLDALKSPLAEVIRTAESRFPHDIMQRLVGGYRGEEHWLRVDARGIAIRSIALFALTTIASKTSNDPTPDLHLYPLELVAHVSDPSGGEPPWLLLAPVVAAVLTDRPEAPHADVGTIADDVLAWALEHHRLDELCAEVGRVRRAHDDRELRVQASLVAQVACTPDLHR